MSEVRIEDQLTIAASTQEVWQAIADPASHARWHPFVTEISGGQRLGDVRTCSVLIGGKRGETRERCVVEDQGSRIAWLVEEDSTGFGRMVSNWDAGFSLTPGMPRRSSLRQSTFVPGNLGVRLLLPVIRGKFHKTQRAILAALKESLETNSRLGESGGATIGPAGR
jgi:hypothetical protein